jgi:hypothetical protein
MANTDLPILFGKGEEASLFSSLLFYDVFLFLLFYEVISFLLLYEVFSSPFYEFYSLSKFSTVNLRERIFLFLAELARRIPQPLFLVGVIDTDLFSTMSAIEPCNYTIIFFWNFIWLTLITFSISSVRSTVEGSKIGDLLEIGVKFMSSLLLYDK